MWTRETLLDDKQFRRRYVPKESNNWLQKYFKNSSYLVLKNEADDVADTLSACIRDAFASKNQHTTLFKLKQKLSFELTHEHCQIYKRRCDTLTELMSKITSQTKVISTEYTKYQKAAATQTLISTQPDKSVLTTNLFSLKAQIQHNSEKLANLHKILTFRKKMCRWLYSRFAFAKGVKKVQDLIQRLQKGVFQDIMWLISTFERQLNIKFIVLSKDAYIQSDIINILETNFPVDKITIARGVFHPEYYIMIEKETIGDKVIFQLVTYRAKCIFQHDDLPYMIRLFINDKCREKIGHLFAYIPEFHNNNKNNNNDKDGEFDDNDDDDDDDDDHDDKDNMISYSDMVSNVHSLYKDDVCFVFYASSSNESLPGFGHGGEYIHCAKEEVLFQTVLEFAELYACKDWRRKLDPCHLFLDSPFQLDNYRWHSVEHYVEATKFRRRFPEFYTSFTHESGTPLSRSIEMAIAAGKVSGKTLARPEGVHPDTDNMTELGAARLRATYALFSKNEELRGILLKTGSAKLCRFIRKQGPTLYVPLLEARKQLMSQNHNL